MDATRKVSVVAATVISLACGTNVRLPALQYSVPSDLQQYAYSAWAPQFATRLKLSSTQSNLIVSIPDCVPMRLTVEGCRGQSGHVCERNTGGVVGRFKRSKTRSTWWRSDAGNWILRVA